MKDKPAVPRCVPAREAGDDDGDYGLAVFDERDDLFEADASFLNEPGVLVWIKGILPLFHY